MNCPFCGVHIDEHEAGDCLNLWIAQDIFGCKFIKTTQDLLDDAVIGEWKEAEIDDYSGAISAAWEVVEKLSADGYGCKILKHSDPRGDCLCEFWHPKAIDLGRWCSNHQPTAPLAICKAALLAAQQE